MNILTLSRGTIFGREKENCAAMENISSQPISFFKLHAFNRYVPWLIQMLSWRTLSSQQIKNQPCVTDCCFTETAKMKD